MKSFPCHIAIIMDGNGRWAKKRGLPKMMGHRRGIQSIREIVLYCCKLGISILTVYAFSTENWKRPKKEVDNLMGFVKEYIDKELDNFKKNEIYFNCIGRLQDLPPDVKEKIDFAREATKKNKKLIFNVALNYGGRSEIVDAVNNILQEGRRSIDEKNFGDFLYTGGQPDPDLLIRTSGEQRISNFLLWQLSYTEFYFTDKFWPDFRKKDLKEAIEEYQKRQRRYGQ